MAPEERSREGTDRTVLETVIGQITYAAEDVLYMPEGMYGYEEYKKYILWEDERFSPFYWFVCIDHPQLMFPLVPTNVVVDDYAPKLPREVSDELKMFVVTIGETPDAVTANLRAPLVIITEKRRAKQVILTDTQYPLRHKVIRSARTQPEE